MWIWGTSGCLKHYPLLQAGPTQNSDGKAQGFVPSGCKNVQRWGVHTHSGQPTPPFSYPQGDASFTICVVWTSSVPAAASLSSLSPSPQHIDTRVLLLAPNMSLLPNEPAPQSWCHLKNWQNACAHLHKSPIKTVVGTGPRIEPCSSHFLNIKNYCVCSWRILPYRD